MYVSFNHKIQNSKNTGLKILKPIHVASKIPPRIFNNIIAVIFQKTCWTWKHIKHLIEGPATNEFSVKSLAISWRFQILCNVSVSSRNSWKCYGKKVGKLSAISKSLIQLHLGAYQTFMMEIFCDNSERLSKQSHHRWLIVASIYELPLQKRSSVHSHKAHWPEN